MADRLTPREILGEFISLRAQDQREADYTCRALAQLRDPADEPAEWKAPDPKAVRRRG